MLELLDAFDLDFDVRVGRQSEPAQIQLPQASGGFVYLAEVVQPRTVGKPCDEQVGYLLDRARLVEDDYSLGRQGIEQQLPLVGRRTA